MAEIYKLSKDGKVFEKLLDKSLKEFTIPEGVEKIGSRAFKGRKNLESITIPDGITEIADEAFYGCISLKNIIIPNSVSTLYSNAFSGCSSLTSILFPEGIKLWGRLDDSEDDYEEDCIGYCAFSGCRSLTSIVIPEGVNFIANEAFSNCTSLENIVIPNSVSVISSESFSNCTSLENIVIPDSVNEMYSDAFKYCSNLTSIVFPKEVLLWGFTWDEHCEENCIGEGAFSGCSSIKSMVIPQGVTRIDAEAFKDCISLKSIVIPNSVCEIYYEAFSNCTSLENIVIPDSVNKMFSDAFYGCSSLSSIVFPEGVKLWGKEVDMVIDSDYEENCLCAFAGCSSLKSIVIPKGITSIGYEAFYECTSLLSIVIPEGVTRIGYSAFENCTSLENIVIPDSVNKIDDYAFSGCSSLKSLVFPQGAKFWGCREEGSDCEEGWIGKYAFSHCTSLTSIEIPQGVTTIGESAFEDCKNLHTVILPEGLVYIGESAFYGCTTLKNMVIPKSVKYICDYAFDGCDNFYGYDNFDPDPYSIVFTYKSKGKDLEVRTELYKGEIDNDIDLFASIKGKELIKDNDGEVLMSIYDNYDNNITKDLLLDRNLDIIANEDCSHTLYFENVEVGFYMICGIDDETLGAELENCIKRDDSDKFTDLFNPYDYEFHEVLAGYVGGWDGNLNYRIYDENDNQIESGQKDIFFKNIFKYTSNYPGYDCFKKVNTKYIVMCYDAYSIGVVPFRVPKDFNMDNVHFNDGNAFHSDDDDDDRIDLTQIHYKGKVYEADMEDIGDNGTRGISNYHLYKKDDEGRYDHLGTIR